MTNLVDVSVASSSSSLDYQCYCRVTNSEWITIAPHWNTI